MMTEDEMRKAARDVVLEHFHEFCLDLIRRHPKAPHSETRRLASQLTTAAVTQFHAMQTARLADTADLERADIKALRNGFGGET